MEHPKREKHIRRLIILAGDNPDCEKVQMRWAKILNFLTYKEIVRPLILADYEKGLEGTVIYDRYGLTRSQVYRIKCKAKKMALIQECEK